MFSNVHKFWYTVARLIADPVEGLQRSKCITTPFISKEVVFEIPVKETFLNEWFKSSENFKNTLNRK